MWVLGTHLRDAEEQCELLTAESSLQPQRLRQLISFFWVFCWASHMIGTCLTTELQPLNWIFLHQGWNSTELGF